MSNVILAFAPARDSISWAQDAISEFKASAQRFFSGDVAEIVTQLDPKTGESVQKLRFKQAIPGDLARKVTEALTTTRHAFDQAAFAARNLVSGNSRTEIYFPWSATPTDLEQLMKRRGIDQRLWDTFKAHEPYPRSDTHAGGDDLIRSLARLANAKHTVGLRVQGEVAQTGFPTIKGGVVQSLKVLVPRWDPVKNEAELIRWIGDVEVRGNYNFRFQIVLKDTGLAHPVDAADGLDAFNRKAKSVVENLEARCLEICC